MNMLGSKKKEETPKLRPSLPDSFVNRYNESDDEESEEKVEDEVEEESEEEVSEAPIAKKKIVKNLLDQGRWRQVQKQITVWRHDLTGAELTQEDIARILNGE